MSSFSISLKQCQLPALCVYALARLVEILLVELEPDKMALLFDACDRRCAAAHAVVEDGVALVGVGADEIAQQIHWLLSGVEGVGIAGEFYNIYWVPCTFVYIHISTNSTIIRANYPPPSAYVYTVRPLCIVDYTRYDSRYYLLVLPHRKRICKCFRVFLKEHSLH